MFSKYHEIRARRARGEEGFTLIELLVVVVIIGILIAIAIPVYLNYQKGAHDKAAESDVRNAIVTLEQCASDDGKYPTADETPPADTTGVIGDCTQKFTVSEGVALLITSSDTEYSITGQYDGSEKVFAYDSTVGGPVAAKPAPETP